MTDTPILLMSPAKVLARLGAERLHQAVPQGSVIITSGSVPVDPGHVARVEYVDDYAHNDLIPLLAESLIREHALERIAVLAEADVLRAAELRVRCGLEGAKPEDVVPYRDKVRMKDLVEQAGIRVARRHTVSTALQLRDAVSDLGLPCVIKPPEGRGSAGVRSLVSDADVADFLRAGPFSDRGQEQIYLVEAFQQGEQYRVDGVCMSGEFAALSVAVYVNSHLDYLGGGYLGSILLPEESDEARRMVSLAQEVLFSALPRFDGGFHLEAFDTPSGPVFSEVGARLGGGSIPAEIELAYGIDIVETSILAQRGISLPHRPAQRGLAGQLHVSPRAGRLIQAPAGFRNQKVAIEEIAAAGQIFSAMTHTNAEFARAVFRADSVADGRATIDALLSTLHGGCVWESA